MRQTVEVNGITLTRTQVENAMKQLNEPEGWPHLTPVIEVCGHKRRGVVIVHKEMHNIMAQVMHTLIGYSFRMTINDWQILYCLYPPISKELTLGPVAQR